MSLDFEQARSAMIERQVRPWEVLDPRVLGAMTAQKREDFVPVQYRKLAFADLAIPLDHHEFMMKPVVEGRMLQALDLQPEDCVLEVGTGSGYITACLGDLARAVLSIDVHVDFVERARARFQSEARTNIEVRQADLADFEPARQFDAICITGALSALPDRVFAWLRPGGRLFAVVGQAPVLEAVRWQCTADGIVRESLFETEVPYLRGFEPQPAFVL